MKLIKIITLTMSALFLLSCSDNKQTNNKPKNVPEEKPEYEMLRPLKCINFFGAEMYGTIEEIVDKIDKTDAVVIKDTCSLFDVYGDEKRFYVLAEFYGVLCGLNIHYSTSKNVVKELIFLTSDDSYETYKTWHDEIFKYYEKLRPVYDDFEEYCWYIDDEGEERCRWHLIDYYIVLRRLHIDEGGRTVYFSL